MKNICSIRSKPLETNKCSAIEMKQRKFIRVVFGIRTCNIRSHYLVSSLRIGIRDILPKIKQMPTPLQSSTTTDNTLHSLHSQHLLFMLSVLPHIYPGTL